MTKRIQKSIFVQAYNNKQKISITKIGFRKIPITTFNPTVSGWNQKCSLSHLMFDLMHVMQSEKIPAERKLISKIAKKIYKEEHSHYGCIRKLIY